MRVFQGLLADFQKNPFRTFAIMWLATNIFDSNTEFLLFVPDVLAKTWKFLNFHGLAVP